MICSKINEYNKNSGEIIQHEPEQLFKTESMEEQNLLAPKVEVFHYESKQSTDLKSSENILQLSLTKDTSETERQLPMHTVNLIDKSQQASEVMKIESLQQICKMEISKNRLQLKPDSDNKNELCIPSTNHALIYSPEKKISSCFPEVKSNTCISENGTSIASGCNKKHDLICVESKLSQAEKGCEKLLPATIGSDGHTTNSIQTFKSNPNAFILSTKNFIENKSEELKQMDIDENMSSIISDRNNVNSFIKNLVVDKDCEESRNDIEKVSLNDVKTDEEISGIVHCQTALPNCVAADGCDKKFETDQDCGDVESVSFSSGRYYLLHYSDI